MHTHGSVDTLRRIQARLLWRFPALQPGRLGWGAAQLSGASLLSRLVGFVYSAAVMRLAGPEAVGLFRMVWPLYGTAYTVAAAGVPYAMSKLVAEATADQLTAAGPGPRAQPPRKTATQGLSLLLFSSVVTGAALYWLAPWLAGAVTSEPRAVPALQLLAPSLVAASLSTGVRALFEGVRRMAIPAASLLTEQLVLSAAAAGLSFHLATSNASPAAIAAALALASAVGEVAGLLAMTRPAQRLWREWSAREPGTPPGSPLAASRLPRLRHWWPGAILQLSLPVTGGRVLSSVGASLTTLLLPNRLHAAGLSPSDVAAQVGLLRGIALPLVLTPNMLSLSLMSSLVPSISRAMAEGKRAAARAYSDKALAITVLFSLPATAAMAALPEFLTRVLYGEAQAAPLLMLSALGAPFVYLGQTLVGVLRGMGHPDVPVLSHLAGMGVEAVLLWAWVPRPELGIRGAAIAGVLGFAVAYAISQIEVLRRLGTDLTAREFTVPVLAAVAGAILARTVSLTVHGLLASTGTLPAIVPDMGALTAGLAGLAGVYGMALRLTHVWRWLSA